jgi:hypothetical protein
MSGRVLVLCSVLAFPGLSAHAESRAELGVHVAVRTLGEFDVTEAGLGARLSYDLTRWLALEAQGAVFPSDAGSPAFSGSRLEGLAGLRAGPHLDRSSVYLAARGGVVRFAEAPEPFPCILIFPPPLVCRMAAGDTVPAVEVGAGLQVLRGDSLAFRAEVGDQLLRYTGPAFDADREIFDDHRWTHNLRATVGVGWRF